MFHLAQAAPYPHHRHYPHHRFQIPNRHRKHFCGIPLQINLLLADSLLGACRRPVFPLGRLELCMQSEFLLGFSHLIYIMRGTNS